jgi:hypothetical protein
MLFLLSYLRLAHACLGSKLLIFVGLETGLANRLL